MSYGAHGDLARSSGLLGEEAAKVVFGLSEPEVEIKTLCEKNYRVVLKLAQLERMVDKEFLIVIYSRGSRKLKRNKKREYELSIEDAFKRPLEFIFVSGETLCQLISREGIRAEFVKQEFTCGGHFCAYVPVKFLRKGKPQLFKKHRVYNGAEYIEVVKSIPF